MSGVSASRDSHGRVKILLVSGSLRGGSVNTAVLRTAASLVDDNIRATLYEGLDELPHFNPDDDPEGGPVHPAVADLRRQLAEADAVLLCTPEYAGALPGSFKNLLDWTVGGGETYGKPVAWINASSRPDPSGARGAHESLRAVLGYTGVDLVQAACRRVSVPRSALGPDGLVTDPAIREQIAGALSALADHLAHPSPPARLRVSIVEAVQRTDTAFFTALLRRDVPALEALLADDFVIVEVGTGSVHPRTAFLNAIRDGIVAFEAIETFPEEALVRHYTSIAIVVGRTNMSFGGADDSTFHAASRYIHVFRTDGDDWQLISAQGTPMRNEP